MAQRGPAFLPGYLSYSAPFPRFSLFLNVFIFPIRLPRFPHPHFFPVLVSSFFLSFPPSLKDSPSQPQPLFLPAISQAIVTGSGFYQFLARAHPEDTVRMVVKEDQRKQEPIYSSSQQPLVTDDERQLRSRDGTQNPAGESNEHKALGQQSVQKTSGLRGKTGSATELFGTSIQDTKL